MVNRKGWLRIVEATVSILIVLSVILIISQKSSQQQDQDLTRMITPILEEMSRNNSLREKIINEGNGSIPEIRAFVAARIPVRVNYSVTICEVDQICSIERYPSEAVEIFAGERIISSTLTRYNPQKVKIFLWRAPV